MLGFLKMSLLDLSWGLAFLYMSITTMSQYIDAYQQIRLKERNKDRDELIACLSKGKNVRAVKIIESTGDPLLKTFSTQIKSMIEMRYESRNLLRDALVKRLSVMPKVEMPHREALNSFCGDILYVGFFGTIVSQFCLFSKFDMNVSEFSEIFVYMGMAMKSSAFGIAASFIVSRGLIVLGQKMVSREGITKEYAQELINAFSKYVSLRKEAVNAEPSRERSHSLC
jgi:hypothetical protein